MSDPRVQQRDNPLVRKLNRIAAANEEYGTRRQGGGAPIVPVEGPVQGGSGTVLPPPPRPLPAPDAAETLSAEELERLEAEWAADPTNPVNKAKARAAAAAAAAAPPEEPAQSVQPMPSPHSLGSLRFKPTDQIIDVLRGVLFSNGREIALHPLAAVELKNFAYRQTLQAMADEANAQAKAMRELLGISEKEAHGGVSKVRGKKGPKSVPAPKKGVQKVRARKPGRTSKGKPRGNEGEAE